MGWREELSALLKSKKVLVVGAGGIGCELLKNLVLVGFKDIHIVDLDTIDVSNLNRQFLFRREHVGKSKAAVAAEAVKKMQPDTNITYYHDTIFAEKFDYDFYKQFVVVLNALDNRKARTQVNKMCMATRTPMIDGGTAGYVGQVSPYVRGQTMCYECDPPPENTQTFPGCTIRNTPSEHIHCTVWAKHVFNQLFGEIGFDDDVSPDTADEIIKEGGGASGNKTEIEEEGEGAKAEEKEKEDQKATTVREIAETSAYDAKKIFQKLFVDDIEWLLRMDHLWKERRAPQPIAFDDLPNELPCGSSTVEGVAGQIDAAHKLLTPAENGDDFAEVVTALAKSKAETDDGVLTWDKDHEESMKFVAAVANLRAFIFGIPVKSLFEIKSMAGNIIPAIATTNAIIAGAMTVEALKMARNGPDSLSVVALWTVTVVKGKILSDNPPPAPNPKCYICAPQREVTIRVNLDKMTLKQLKDEVLRNVLEIEDADVMDVSTSRILLSSEGDETEALLPHTLAELHVSTGSRLVVEDFEKDTELLLIILSGSTLDSHQYVLISDVPAEEPQQPQLKAEQHKRKREAEPLQEVEVKKAKLEYEIDKNGVEAVV